MQTLSERKKHNRFEIKKNQRVKTERDRQEFFTTLHGALVYLSKAYEGHFILV